MKYSFKIFVTIMLAAISVSFLIFSCTDDRNPEAEEEVILEDDPAVFNDSVIGKDGEWIPGNVICDLGLTITETDTLLFSDHPGTICCVTGPAEADPGDTLTFLYNTNLNDSALIVLWAVQKGSIQLLTGQNTPFATFLCGDDFTGGSVQGHGISQNVYQDIEYSLECSERYDITLK